MTGRDPMRDHIANPRGGRQSIRPIIDSVGRILTEGRKVTPIGIAVSISLPLALIFGVAVWILGKDGIVQITSAWGESAEANRELAKEVKELSIQTAKNTKAVEAIQEELRVQGKGNATKRIVALESNVDFLAEATTKLNGQPLNSGFPRPREGDFPQDPTPEPIIFPRFRSTRQWVLIPYTPQ